MWLSQNPFSDSALVPGDLQSWTPELGSGLSCEPDGGDAFEWSVPAFVLPSMGVNPALEPSFDPLAHSSLNPVSLSDYLLPSFTLDLVGPPVLPVAIPSSTVPSFTTLSPSSSQLESGAGSQDQPSSGGVYITQLPSKACEHCGERFRNDEQLRKHVDIKHAERQYMCNDPRCGSFCTSSIRSFERHLLTATAHVTEATPQFWCRCGFSEYRRDHFKRHLSKKRPCKSVGRPYKCWCNRVFNDTPADKKDFEKHYRLCGAKQRGRPRKENRTGGTGKENE